MHTDEGRQIGRVTNENWCVTARLDCEHVEVDLILPERGHSLPLKAIVREACQLESAEHFSLNERINNVERAVMGAQVSSSWWHLAVLLHHTPHCFQSSPKTDGAQTLMSGRMLLVLNLYRRAKHSLLGSNCCFQILTLSRHLDVERRKC